MTRRRFTTVTLAEGQLLAARRAGALAERRAIRRAIRRWRNFWTQRLDLPSRDWHGSVEDGLRIIQGIDVAAKALDHDAKRRDRR